MIVLGANRLLTTCIYIVNENKSNVLNFEFFSSCSEHDLSDSLEQKDKASNIIYRIYSYSDLILQI